MNIILYGIALIILNPIEVR